MFGHAVAGAALALALAGSSVFVATSSSPGEQPGNPVPAVTRVSLPAPAVRLLRPGARDWEAIEQAARLRRMALAPHRTAAYRSFAAYMALTGLIELRPLRRGRCTLAVSYLYDNLLDLRQAQPGENWRPLRRFVAREPALSACAPRPVQPFHGGPRYEA